MTLTTCPVACGWERTSPTPAYARRITADHMAREHKTTEQGDAS